LCDGYQGYPGKKRGSTDYDGYKKVKGNKLSALVDRNSLSLACTVSPANVHDSRLYEPTLEEFEIPEVSDRPIIISADAAYDAREIRQYNRKRGIKSNIPINRRYRKQPKRGRPVWFDPELYKKRSAVERFFSWIEAFKKIVPRYERYKRSFMGLIHLACGVMVGRILG
jgi:transposase